jgi:hypothetical protein
MLSVIEGRFWDEYAVDYETTMTRDDFGCHHSSQAGHIPHLVVVDKLFRMGLIDAEQADFLRQGVADET